MKTFKELFEKKPVDEAYMSSDRSKQMFKRKELDHELRHEVEPRRAEPAEPHAVHINGKKWKTFPTKSHATNVAKKIAGATVVKESLDEAKVIGHVGDVAGHGKVVQCAKCNTDLRDDHGYALDNETYVCRNGDKCSMRQSKNSLAAAAAKGQKPRWRTDESLDEAVDHHAEAMDHKKQSDAAMDKNDMEAYHQHMSAHHESMGQWHESKGRSSNADKEFEKAEKHHDLSLKKSNQKNEGTEMLSFKNFQQELAEAKKKTKESSCQMELAHGEMLNKDEDNGKEKKEMYVKEGQAPVAPVPGTKSKTHAIMVHPESKQRVTVERKNMKNYPASEGWKEVAPGMKESVEIDEGDELAMRHKFVFNKTAAGKAREVARNREELKMQMKNTKEMGGITGPKGKLPKGKLPEEVEIEEALKGDMHPLAGDVLKHIKPEHHYIYKPYLKNNVYKGNYADRSAVLAAAEKAKHTVNEAASPFDWKAYAKERGTPSSNTTKTFHDVKKTSTGTVYTKQVNPDGMSKGSGDDAAKSAEVEQAPKRGRGRPAGVGAKTGSYKPRDPASKAASAAKAAASKAANRASRNEEFDNEFMGSLIEGFEDEDFDEFLYCEEFDELDEATQEALINFIKMKESLTGKQHKLDKNKNGKIDSHDFTLLRKEETEQVQESVTAYAAFLNKKQ